MAFAAAALLTLGEAIGAVMLLCLLVLVTQPAGDAGEHSEPKG